MRKRLLLAVMAIVPAIAIGGDSAPRVSRWTPLFQGVDECDIVATSPRIARGFALRIDLQDPDVQLFATSANGNRPGETDALRTSTFLSRNSLQAAINAAPFGPLAKVEGDPVDVVGLQISRGKRVSKPHGNYPALMIRTDRTATIATPPFDTEGIDTAVGGFQVILKNGEVLSGEKKVHPRTAVGVSRDGWTMYWLVVDGRQLLSLGATTDEVARWLKLLGASDAINLDGGGTSTLVVEGADGKPRVVNCPVHEGIPGTERIAGSHLGVSARPLSRNR